MVVVGRPGFFVVAQMTPHIMFTEASSDSLPRCQSLNEARNRIHVERYGPVRQQRDRLISYHPRLKWLQAVVLHFLRTVQKEQQPDDIAQVTA
jgi:hypothetical protein